MTHHKLNLSLKFTWLSFLTILFSLLCTNSLFLTDSVELTTNNLSIIALGVVIFGIFFSKYSIMLKDKNILHFGVLFLFGLFISITTLNIANYGDEDFSRNKSIEYLYNVELFFAILSFLFFILYNIFKKNYNLFKKYAYTVPALAYISSCSLIFFNFNFSLLPSIFMSILLGVIFSMFYYNIKDQTTDKTNKNSLRTIFWTSLISILMFFPPL